MPRLCTALFLAGVYFTHLFMPIPSSFDHGYATFELIVSPWDTRMLLPVAVAALWFAAIGLMLRRGLGTGVWAALCTVAAFAPASNLFVLVGTEFAERLLYLPSAYLAVTIAVLWACAAPHYHKLQGSRPLFGRLGQLAVALVFVWYSVQTVQRNAEWKSEASLFESGVRSRPNSLKALNNRASMLMVGTPDEQAYAERLLLRTVGILPNNHLAFMNLGLLYKNQGRNAESITALAAYVTHRHRSLHLASRHLFLLPHPLLIFTLHVWQCVLQSVPLSS